MPEQEKSDEAMTARSTFSELLKRHRRAAGCSQEALAERSGLSVRAISALEQSTRRGPYRETVVALCDALGLSEDARTELEEAAANARGRSGKDASVLPVPLTTFIERPEVAEISELLLTHRLLTVTGPGGVGKTRIALEVARRTEETFDQTWFVDVLLVRDPGMLAPYIAAKIGATSGSGEALSAIARALGPRHTLLVLDNCEHLIDETATILVALLRDNPQLRVLVTSRESIGLIAELVFRLSPMSAVAATELFVARARTQNRSLFFDAERLSIVAAICEDLERIPLAIELAASRLSTLGFVELHKRLKSGPTSGSHRDLPVRHQTIDDTIRWSYDLLSDTDKLLLACLSVFIGGFTLAGAEDVCEDPTLPAAVIADGVFRLVQKSLIDVELIGTSSRYRFLETIRAFAWQRLLQTGDAANRMDRLSEWLTREARASTGAQWARTVRDLRDDLDNVAAVASWAVETEDQSRIVAATRAVIDFRSVWYGANRHEEMRVIGSALLPRIDEDTEPELVGLLLSAMIPFLTGEQQAAVGPRAIQLLTSTGHLNHAANVHSRLAQYECTLGHAPAAKAHLTAGDALLAAAKRQGTPLSMSFFITSAYVRAILQDFEGARAALELVVVAPGDPRELEVSLVRAEIEFREQHFEAAHRLLTELKEQLSHYARIPLAVMVYGNAAKCELLLGDAAAAEADLREALTQIADTRDPSLTTVYLALARYAAAISARAGRVELAARMLGASGALENPATLETDPHGTELTLAALRTTLTPKRMEALRTSGEGESLFDLVEEFLAN